MPYKNVPANKNFFGWFRDQVNNTLELYDGAGAKVATGSTAAFAVTGALTATTSIAATTTVTGGTDVQATAGHFLGPVGNVKLGTATAFATTQPVAAVVMGGTSKAGIAPVGAIATCGAVFASDTAVMKIVAGGTANNVET